MSFKDPLTCYEFAILEMIGDKPRNFSGCERTLSVDEGDSLRPSTVSCLLIGLTNAGYLEKSLQGIFTLTESGSQAVNYARGA